jgi:hypothetical protein
MGSRLERIEKTVSRCWHKPYLVPRTPYGASRTSEFLPVLAVASWRNSAASDPAYAVTHAFEDACFTDCGLGVTGWGVRKEGCENGVAEGFVKASFPSKQPFFFFPALKTTRSTTRGVGLDI